MSTCAAFGRDGTSSAPVYHGAILGWSDGNLGVRILWCLLSVTLAIGPYDDMEHIHARNRALVQRLAATGFVCR